VGKKQYPPENRIVIESFTNRARSTFGAGKTMQQLIEFYEMVSLNDAALRDSERTAILKARLALRMFERAMESFKTSSTEAAQSTGASFRVATVQA
jgi:hypothetical protein